MLAIVGAVLMLSLAMHPELRLLLPILDAVGLETLLMVLGAQTLALCSSWLRPMLIAAWKRVAPWLARFAQVVFASASGRNACAFLDRQLERNSGVLGEYLWVHAGRVSSKR